MKDETELKGGNQKGREIKRMRGKQQPWLSLLNIFLCWEKNYLIDIQYLNRMNYQFDSENVLKLWFSFDAVGEVFWFFFKKIASSVLFEWSFSISLQTSCFIALPFIDICRYYVFYKLTVCGNLASSKTIGTIFPIAFAHLWSLSHILLILTIFQTFSLLSYLLRWSVIFYVTTAKRLQLPKGSENG